MSAEVGLVAAEGLSDRPWSAAGVSDAPGVPGVRVMAAPEGAAAFGPPVVVSPPEGVTLTCAQAPAESTAVSVAAAVNLNSLCMESPDLHERGVSVRTVQGDLPPSHR
jgi:hypothetical protein